MNDDELRQACEKFLAGIAMDALNTVRYRARVDRVVRFARQQQAAGVRMALSHVSSPYWYRELEAKAKELES